MKIAILSNDDPKSSKKWQLACEKYHINYDVINLASSNWLNDIRKSDYNFFLTKPPGSLEHFKIQYDEKLYIIAKILKKKVFPSYEECYIYENKKLLSYFLDANDIPHPKTNVFYLKKEAIEFINKTSFPLVAKTSIGASGSGVEILKTKNVALKYIKKAFSGKGIRRRLGPNRVTGTPVKWFSKAIKSPAYFKKKIIEYLSIYKHGERDFVLFQEYIPHEFEWRIVKIGESFFGHQKIKIRDKASGTKGIDFIAPPETLLTFVRNLCSMHNFNFMAVDIFEKSAGIYLVNELQTIFGHVQDYILAVDGIPGRYIFDKNKWIFEQGDFNTNESYDLRLKVALELYGKEKNINS